MGTTYVPANLDGAPRGDLGRGLAKRQHHHTSAPPPDITQSPLFPTFASFIPTTSSPSPQSTSSISTPSSINPKTNQQPSPALIGGEIVAALALICIVGSVFTLRYRRHKRRSRNSDDVVQYRSAKAQRGPHKLEKLREELARYETQAAQMRKSSARAVVSTPTLAPPSIPFTAATLETDVGRLAAEVAAVPDLGEEVVELRRQVGILQAALEHARMETEPPPMYPGSSASHDDTYS